MPKSLQDEEEPAVTGKLIESIRCAMNVDDGPEWMNNFSIHDNAPVNVCGRTGKNRPIVDFQFEFVASGPRPLFRIEAKWLGTQKTSIGSKEGYLGSEGIGCFLSGKYPANIGHAGMLGYIHSEDETVWAAKIEEHFRRNSAELKVVKSNGQVWQRDKIQKGYHAFISVHACKASIGTLKITHLFLRFC